MADPVFGFNESDAHNLVRLIRNDRTDLDETPLPLPNYTSIYIAELTDATWSLLSFGDWSARAIAATIYSIKNQIIETTGSNTYGKTYVVDPLEIFSDDLKAGDRLYCVPFEDVFIALQAPCGG